jgi:hypothetical protein
MDEKTIQASNTNQGLKNFIIGKMWLTSQDGNRPGTIKISRNLPSDVLLKAGTTLFLGQNTKREGKMDADFNVSILLPEAVANQLITAEKAIAATVAPVAA